MSCSEDDIVGRLKVNKHYVKLSLKYTCVYFEFQANFISSAFFSMDSGDILGVLAMRCLENTSVPRYLVSGCLDYFGKCINVNGPPNR